MWLQDNGEEFGEDTLAAYQSQCEIAEPAENFATHELDEETPDTFNDYVAILGCAIGVAINVSEEYELQAIWEKYEPTIDTHLANIKQCATLGDAKKIQQ